MAIPPFKFFKDFNATNITTATNSSSSSGADTNNATANTSIPTPSTTPPPAYNLGMPPPGTFYNPYDRPLGYPPGLQQPYSHSAYHVQNALGLVPAVQYGPPISGGPRFNVSPQVEVDDDEDVSDAKTIKIHINCAISVKGNNNNVKVSPVVGVGKVVSAVVQAIREASMCQGGIPMIDEDGVPRGVNVQVEAGMTVDGDGNVVGEAGSFGGDEQNTRLMSRDVVAQATMEDRVAAKRERDDEGDSTVVAEQQRRSKNNRRP